MMDPLIDNPVQGRLLLLTGPSGAGRSTALRALEDVGFEAIDNMPFSLVPRLVQGKLDRPLALVLDPRNRDFSVNALLHLVERLAAMPGLDFDLVYLDCSEKTLIQRYSETRRRHPLSPDQPARDGIELEARLLRPVRLRADVLIETDGLTPHELRAEMQRRFAAQGSDRMSLQIQSFSYKRGIPAGVDMVFDCRFLKNPHWEPNLRAQDGRDGPVADYVEADPRFAPFFRSVHDLVVSLLPEFSEEGKTQLVISFGCTGGQHRSVAITEKLAKALAQAGWQVSKRHRELERVAAHRGVAKEE